MNTRSQNARLESPCTKICTLDAAGLVCIGCRRTVAEIAGWARMDDRSRAAVLARLAAETRGHGAAGEGIYDPEPR